MITGFAGKFESIEVLCLEKGQYDLPSNVDVISLGKDRGEGKVAQLFNFYKFILGSHSRYDSVLVHMNPIWVVLGGYLWKLFDKKIFLWYTHKAVTIKLKIAAMVSDIILTASPESFRLLSHKVIVTGHGIDTDLFRPDASKLQATSYQLRLLSVGRLAPVKNYETLVDAARILKEKGVNFKVTIIGEVPMEKDREYAESLKFKVKSLKLGENFEFVGKIDHQNLPQYYQSHDIFVHLSKTGSLDKTILEAMACGMKVLSSNDASKSFLPPKLIFNDNSPSELADKIIALSKVEADPTLREYVVKNHNLNNLIDKISSIINP